MATKGIPLALTGTVEPANATNKTIVWSVKNAGTTGAAIVDGNKLQTSAGGTVTVTATITNGLTASSPYAKDFTVTVNDGFVAVSTINGVPGTAVAGTPLALTGTVEPANATNRTIAWSVKNAGTTGAAIVDGNKLQTSAGGTVTVTATITNGLTASTPYTKDFDITVSPASSAFVAVSNISGVPAEAVAGTPLTLTGTVEPANATNKTIAWTVTNAGSTGASIVEGNKLQTTAPGAVTVTATITNGLTASSPYTQDFPVQIKAPQLTIPSYIRHSYGTVTDIDFSNIRINGFPLADLPAWTPTSGGSNNQGFIRNKWLDFLRQMHVQGDNLKNGYSAVASAYPNLPGIGNIISNENGGSSSIHGKIDNTNDIATYLTGADANINSIIGGIITDRAQFDKYLAAYKAGHYSNAKVRNDDGSKTAAQAAFAEALAASGCTSLVAVETAMLNAINAAMGVNGITNANHGGVISGLNSDLIKQIQDLAQAGAVADDFSGLGYTNTLSPGTTFSMYPAANNQYNQPEDAQTVPSVD